jgi:hypothetical protein
MKGTIQLVNWFVRAVAFSLDLLNAFLAIAFLNSLLMLLSVAQGRREKLVSQHVQMVSHPRECSFVNPMVSSEDLPHVKHWSVHRSNHNVSLKELLLQLHVAQHFARDAQRCLAVPMTMPFNAATGGLQLVKSSVQQSLILRNLAS